MAAALDLPTNDRNADECIWTLPDPKFSVPRRPRSFVDRPRVASMFSHTGRRPGNSVTISAAGIGAGKTTAVADLARSLEAGTAAWCTLDSGDNEPFRFGVSVLEAVLTARRAGTARLGFTFASPSRDPLDQALLIAADTPELLLVLDQVDELRIDAVGATLARLLHRVPSTVSVVLLTHQDLDLPARLRASSEIREVRAADLAFTTDEAQDLFARYGVVIRSVNVDALTQWTHGSAAALKLAAGALRLGCNPVRLMAEARRGEHAAHDVLVGLILDRLPAETRRFLVSISITGQVHVDLAAAIAGVRTAEAAPLMEAIASDDLFLEPLIGRPGWYRQHRLFADLLRARLHHERPAEVAALYARAARWFDAAGRSDEAMRSAVAGNDWDSIVSFVLDRWTEAALDGTPCALDAVPEVPLSLREHDVASALAISILDLQRAGSVSSPMTIRESRQLPERTQLPYALYAYETARNHASPEGVEAAAQTLHEWSLEHHEPSELSNKVAGAAARARAEALLMNADLEGAAEVLEGTIVFGTATGDDMTTANATASLALVTALTGRVRRAVALTDELGETWAVARSDSVRGVRALTLALCAYHADRLPAAREALVEARALLGSGPAADTILPVVRARIVASLGDVDGAQRLLDRATMKGRSGLLAAVRDALGLWPDRRVRKLAPHATGHSSTPVHPYIVATGELHRASSLYASAGFADAKTALERALSIVARHGYRRLFIDAGLPVRRLLTEYATNALAFRMLASELIERMQDDDRPDQRTVVEAMTERELTVLRHLPTMLSNREIAAEMYFSVNTVKTHLKSIYRKLDVSRRRDAVERAQALSIV